MTDENTLPDGWTQGYEPLVRLTETSDGRCRFFTETPEGGIHIARALSAPSVETDIDDNSEYPVEIWVCPDDDEWITGSWDLTSDGQGPEVLYVRGDLVNDLAPTPAPDLTQNTTRWDLLTQEVREAFRALPEEALQCWTGADWMRKFDAFFAQSVVYRQNPDWTPEPETTPDVPWDVLTDEISKGVKVETGPNRWTVYGCIGTPVWNEERQTWMGGNSCRMLPLSEIMDIDPGTCHPRDSLVQRPKGDE